MKIITGPVYSLNESRRHFLWKMAALALPLSSFRMKQDAMTVKEVIGLILKSIPAAPFKQTVDTIKAGNIDQKVTGIVTTMFATVDVIRETIRLGANFIIAHEPTYYNHLDVNKGLEKDEVYTRKLELLNKHGIVVWRFHDYIHAHKPDGVLMGVLEALGWEKYYDEKDPLLIKIPPVTLGAVVELAETKLGISKTRYIGELTEPCSRILLIPGAAGGQMQLAALQKYKPDLLIVGELNEWETSEYIRDARALKMKTSLIVLGHVQSEEPGMAWLQRWLQPQLKDIKVTHVPSGDEFRFS